MRIIKLFLLFVLMGVLGIPLAWADVVIIDKQTRVVSRVTSDSIPEFDPAIEAAIAVPDRFDLQGCPCKLDLDNNTLLPVTKQELDQTDEHYQPQLKTRRLLRQAFVEAINDAENSETIKSVLRQLRDLYQ
mgnify:CR=1